MDKEQRYITIRKQIASVCNNETNIIAKMATICCLLSQEFEYYYWTGFYIVDPQKERELVIGPYQGTLGCLRIPFGKGVCGTAASTGETQLVADVHKFPGHIACDDKSNSEIVVPVVDKDDNLLAVFDVDSTIVAAFDEIDQKYLEAILNDTFKYQTV